MNTSSPFREGLGGVEVKVRVVVVVDERCAIEGFQVMLGIVA